MSKTKTRIYVVADQVAEADYLVRAVSRQQALAYIAQQRFWVQPASQDHLVLLLQGGAKVFNATATADEPE